ncbi:cysteine desulfurase [Sphaerisporangium rufum]|uniref:cysteine desulfurase n=1 Tax=Sphaerisporangium rufum TaxID=1381558 RepID=A0A919V4N2_9ACTN|nr:cysteine desulfurase family protein [Sphaerisporangium rufum]GII81373.1 cysteine desulfurase [Sphaerisporangium rufum]
MSAEANRADVVYLDYNATSPLRPEALEVMLDTLRSVGNASSIHTAGRDAAARVDLARQQVAHLLACAPGELIFTSGATEANNLALHAGYSVGETLATTAVEHPAIREAARAITTDGRGSLVELPVDRDGVVNLTPLEVAIRQGKVSLVSAMLANNETGVLTNMDPIIGLAREAGALVHTDATQYVGRLPLDLNELDVDLLSLSGHKFGGPQGVGALFVRRGTSMPYRPLLIGGGQERGWRAGTLNVPGIAGLGAAAKAAQMQLHNESARVASLRYVLEDGLTSRLPDCYINGARSPRLPGVTNVTFPGLPADALLAAMPEIAASNGSACASGAPSPSHVLLAMGLSRQDADSTVRFSLGYATTEHEIKQAIEATVLAVKEVRTAMAATAEP